MKIETFGSMIGREMEVNITKYGEFATSNHRDLTFAQLNLREQTCFKEFAPVKLRDLIFAPSN